MISLQEVEIIHLLISNQMDIQATQEEKYGFVINIASGKSSFEEILDWLTHHVEKSSS